MNRKRRTLKGNKTSNHKFNIYDCNSSAESEGQGDYSNIELSSITSHEDSTIHPRITPNHHYSSPNVVDNEVFIFVGDSY